MDRRLVIGTWRISIFIHTYIHNIYIYIYIHINKHITIRIYSSNTHLYHLTIKYANFKLHLTIKYVNFNSADLAYLQSLEPIFICMYIYTYNVCVYKINTLK